MIGFGEFIGKFHHEREVAERARRLRRYNLVLFIYFVVNRPVLNFVLFTFYAAIPLP